METTTSTTQQTTETQVTSSVHSLETLQDIANILRLHVVEMTTSAGSGYPTSCASMADIIAVLFFDPSGMHYDPSNPKSFSSDRFYLSKGHAAPLLYAAWAHNGLIDKSELEKHKRLDSQLTAYPHTALPFIDVASGNYGQGLSISLGMGYASKYLDKIDNKYFVVLGEAEVAEGQIWEASNFGSFYKLDNVIAFVDLSEEGSDGQDLEKKFKAFGCNTRVIDGHNIQEIIEALDWARSVTGAPAIVLARTIKGKNLGPEIQGKEWQGRPLGDFHDAAVSHLKSLIKDSNARLVPKKPLFDAKPTEKQVFKLPPLNYTKGKEVAIRNAYGNALKSLGDKDSTNLLMSLDGDTNGSTMACFLAKAHPKKFVECFIAEQNMVSIGQGLAARGKIPFCSTFGAFFSRTFDQIRLIGVSQSNVKFCGSHAGVSIGADGPTQMALEDLAMFRTVPRCVVFYPSDAVSAERATELAINHDGPVFIRTSRPTSVVIYDNDEIFEIGKSKIVRQTTSDVLTIVTSGVTLPEALNASTKLAQQGINVRVVDLFSVKPIDAETLEKCAKETGGKVLTVEDHYPEGGIHEAVSTVLNRSEVTVYKIAVHSTPSSGSPQDLYDKYNLSAKKIEAHIKTLLQ